MDFADLLRHIPRCLLRALVRLPCCAARLWLRGVRRMWLPLYRPAQPIKRGDIRAHVVFAARATFLALLVAGKIQTLFYTAAWVLAFAHRCTRAGRQPVDAPSGLQTRGAQTPEGFVFARAHEYMCPAANTTKHSKRGDGRPSPAGESQTPGAPGPHTARKSVYDTLCEGTHAYAHGDASSPDMHGPAARICSCVFGVATVVWSTCRGRARMP